MTGFIPMSPGSPTQCLNQLNYLFDLDVCLDLVLCLQRDGGGGCGGTVCHDHHWSRSGFPHCFLPIGRAHAQWLVSTGKYCLYVVPPPASCGTNAKSHGKLCLKLVHINITNYSKTSLTDHLHRSITPLYLSLYLGPTRSDVMIF